MMTGTDLEGSGNIFVRNRDGNPLLLLLGQPAIIITSFLSGIRHTKTSRVCEHHSANLLHSSGEYVQMISPHMITFPCRAMVMRYIFLRNARCCRLGLCSCCAKLTMQGTLSETSPFGQSTTHSPRQCSPCIRREVCVYAPRSSLPLYF